MSSVSSFLQPASASPCSATDNKTFRGPSPTRVADYLTLRVPAARHLSRENKVEIPFDGYCDRGVVDGQDAAGEKVVYPAFRPWDLEEKAREGEGFATLFLRVRLTKNIQLLRGLDLRAHESFFVPFSVIRSVSFAIESDPLGSSPPPVLVCDPQ